jgi:predicted ArsR family transcriptional regulator
MGKHSYHNTLFLDDQLVRQYETKAKTQEEFIYGIFLQHKELTKADLIITFQEIGDPMTEMSISRALTNLQTEGKIYLSTDKRMGVYGRPNGVYKLVTGEEGNTEVEHRLKLNDNECLALELILNVFKEKSDKEDYKDQLWDMFNSINNKLSKIKY